MSWEIVGMLAAMSLILMIVGLFLTVIANMITEARTKRQIALFEAGLLPPGWVRK